MIASHDADRTFAKVTARLIPFLLLMYVLAFLDRTNIGFAHDAFEADTGLGNAAYAFGASIFFIGYALFEVPSNIILARVGPKIWMARIMVTWGLVSAAMMFATTEGWFYGLRFLLGICEAGFFPGAIFYLTRWYPPERRGRAMGLFYFGAPLAFILGGPLSGALLEMDGMAGLHGWQWLFMVQGLAASAVGVIAWFYLDNGPADARWLTEAERATIVAALPPETPHRESLADIARALANVRVLHLAAIYLLIQASVYGVVFFLPSQVAKLVGTSVGFKVGAITAIPWACALLATWLLPRWSDRTGQRRLAAGGALIAAAIGIAASVAAGSATAGLIALSLAASGFIAAQPVFWSIATARLGGASGAAAIALINACGALGSFLAPNIRVAADSAAGYDGAGLYLLAGTTAFGALLLALLGREASQSLRE